MKTKTTILALAFCLIPGLSLRSQESKNESQPLPKIYIDVTNETALRVRTRLLKGKDGSKGCLLIASNREEAERFIEITESREQFLNWGVQFLTRRLLPWLEKTEQGRLYGHLGHGKLEALPRK